MTKARFLIVLGVLSSVVPLSSVAHAQTTSIQVLSQPSESGFTVPVPIVLDANQQVVGLQFDLIYDSVRLALGEPSLGPGLSNITLSSRRLVPGKRRFLIYANDLSVLPDSILINVPGTIPPGVTSPTISITLADARASDNLGGEVTPLTLRSGVITLIDGVPVYFDTISVAADGTAFLSFTGVSGREVALDFSTDLESWSEIGILEIEDGEIFEVVDPEGLRTHGFYRARIISP